MFKLCRHSLLTLSFFSKVIIDMKLKFSSFTKLLMVLSNDISHVVLAQYFIISTCLRSIDMHETAIECVYLF